MKHSNIKIIKDDLNPETPELLADSIVKISDMADKFFSTQLNKKCIVLLLHDITRLPRRDIEMVLDNLPKLKSYYIKKDYEK